MPYQAGNKDFEEEFAQQMRERKQKRLARDWPWVLLYAAIFFAGVGALIYSDKLLGINIPRF